MASRLRNPQRLQGAGLIEQSSGQHDSVQAAEEVSRSDDGLRPFWRDRAQ